MSFCEMILDNLQIRQRAGLQRSWKGNSTQFTILACYALGLEQSNQ